MSSATNDLKDSVINKSDWRNGSLKPLFLVAIVYLCPVMIGRAQIGSGLRTVQFREPHQTRYTLVETASTNRTLMVRSTAVNAPPWTRAKPDGSTNPVELGSRVVVQLAPGKDLNLLLTNQNLSLSRTIASNLFILQAPDSLAAIDAAEALATQDGVVAAYPVMRRALRLHNAYASAPNDPYFADQWHLENRGPDGNLAGPDLNVRAAWPLAKGAGTLVAVADVGFQLDHPELINPANGQPHFNFFETNSDGGPYAFDADHATAVAGLIAAEGDNHRGVVGVAPQARLASWVIFGFSPLDGTETIATDEQLMEMFQSSSNRVAVQNHSWGNADASQSPIDLLSDVGISNAVTRGRGGKGVVLVRAGGNGRDFQANVNDDGFASDPRAIAVAAIRLDGRACSYSSAGASLLVGAPSGDVIDTDGDGIPDTVDPTAPDVLTTDRTGLAGYNSSLDDSGDYTGFDGTSASTPQVAGVAALVLSANTNLSYRDVQQILIHSARHYDLADPDLRTNGAGFLFSHNAGFGVPDAGFAVQLAKSWSNRPASTRLTFQSTVRRIIPDDSLRVVAAAAGIPVALTNIHCLPSLGPHPDDPTGALPLVYVGQANADLTQDLHGKAALIQRGTSFFYEKIGRAARAGAAFAVIFNNTGTTAIQAMGATDYVPIPAVSIGQTDGLALVNWLALHPTTTAKIQLTPAVYRFTNNTPLLCEHVGLRLQTTHSSRSDVRVTLVSPMGTRSVLEAINQDTSTGPSDWTYWSTQHFYESSFGQWRLEVSDELNTSFPLFPSGSSPATGVVTSAQLIIDGVAITDTDHDGLDDNWEMKHLGNLNSGPRDDPDNDGFNNAREQVMGTDPAVANAPFKLDMANLNPGLLRLSWPARPSTNYTLASGTDLSNPLTTLTNLPGHFPVTELVVPAGISNEFYRVRQGP